jgi:uncharacterized protein YjiS (DUF1127 family)
LIVCQQDKNGSKYGAIRNSILDNDHKNIDRIMENQTMYQKQTIQHPYIGDGYDAVTPARLFAAYDRLQSLATTISRAFDAWRKNVVDHTRLYRLNDHVLRDIGITRHDIGHGPAESFWRD